MTKNLNLSTFCEKWAWLYIDFLNFWLGFIFKNGLASIFLE